jgi:dipeptide transport system ATP-binding protein
MALLEVRNLTVRFPTRSGFFTAVDGVDVTLARDEALAIVGESGSGKSVAMLAVMGLLPKQAEVRADVMRFAGADLLTTPAKARRALAGRDMAMIFQEPMSSLNPCFTVGFQISEALKTHLKLSRSERRARVVALLREVGIPDPERRVHAFPHQLSGGMSQRVMIAMALACQPKLLIADEPTTALDVTMQAQILDLLLALRERNGMALVLITHDMGVVAETADRVIVQYAGQQVETNTTRELFGNPHHPYTAALLAALPERATQGRLPAIPGVVPGQFDRPKGCLFEPRCEFAFSACRAAPRRWPRPHWALRVASRRSTTSRPPRDRARSPQPQPRISGLARLARARVGQGFAGCFVHARSRAHTGGGGGIRLGQIDAGPAADVD